jgi:hypothetical protein
MRLSPDHGENLEGGAGRFVGMGFYISRKEERRTETVVGRLDSALISY